MSGREQVGVLIVGDDPTTRAALRTAADELDLKVVAARTAEEITFALSGNHFAAILIDATAPGVDPLVAARHIRTGAHAPNTPIVFITDADPASFPLRDAYRLGAVDHITKPIVPEVLAGKLAFLVESCWRNAALKRAEAIGGGYPKFLLELGSATQTLHDPEEIVRVTAGLLGRHLGASRCAYAEVESDSERFTIRGDYTDGCASSAGDYHLSLFGPRAAAKMRSGRTLVVRDVDRELPPGEGAETFNAIGVKAIVCCPLVKFDRLAAMMAVHQTEPRDWTADEVSLVEAVVERSWAHIERARAERRLRESEARFRTLAETIPQLAWTTRADGHVEWYNRRWFEYTGTTPEQMEGWGWRSVLDPAVLPAVEARWAESLATGAPFDMVFPLKGADGRYRPFLALGMPLKDATGRVLQWFGTNTDVSAQKAAEAVLREEGQRKDEFIDLFAHELRNPLNPISNAVQLLALRPDPPTVERARLMIDRQVKQLSHIVSDLLEFSRLAQRRIELRRDRVELADLARATAEAEAERYTAAGVTLELHAPETPVWVSGDRARLTQVLSNLLSNAVKFTPRGGRVDVRVGASGTDAVMAVSDSGAGMESAMIGRLFRPLTQADQGLARTQGGLGLGLSLVKGLVELHGGVVRAESAGPDRGSTFTVTLPRAGEPAALKSASTGAAVPERTRVLRVLVIEDNRDSADSLKMLLEICGCEVTVAYTGPDGLAAAKANRPDLVLCDIGLPGMSGYEIARELSATRSAREPLLVALTGYGRDEDKARAAASGFDRHFVKPMDPEALEDLLSGV